MQYHASERPQRRTEKALGKHDTPSHGFRGIRVAEAGMRRSVSLYTDKTLVCADCGQEFLFTASEQEFYAARQFSEPRRCGSCRAIRKAQRGGDSAGYSASGGGYGNGGGYGSRGGYGGGGGYGGSRGPREMFDVVCSSCGKEAQVPFRPTSGKPVYCNDCFAARRA
jgi:CxxC-x17-CxxC domain-containing protein